MDDHPDTSPLCIKLRIHEIVFWERALPASVFVSGLTAGARVSTQLISPCTPYELTSEEGPTASGTNRRRPRRPASGMFWCRFMLNMC